MVVHEIVNGDCLAVMASMPDEHAQLIYLDPPFFTGKDHKQVTRDGNKSYVFSDSWKSDHEYYYFIVDRLKEMRRVLNRSGSIFLHCDANASHITRLALNDAFGCDNFGDLK